MCGAASHQGWCWGSGSLYQLIRDPALVPPVLFILGSAASDDRAYCLGRAILRRDEREIPQPDARRLLALMPDGLVRLTVDGRHRWRRDATMVYNVGWHAVERLRELSNNSDPIHVPGVGSVRMCLFEARDEKPLILCGE
jgi:hypothetical protein